MTDYVKKAAVTETCKIRDTKAKMRLELNERLRNT